MKMFSLMSLCVNTTHMYYIKLIKYFCFFFFVLSVNSVCQIIDGWVINGLPDKLLNEWKYSKGHKSHIIDR